MNQEYQDQMDRQRRADIKIDQARRKKLERATIAFIKAADAVNGLEYHVGVFGQYLHRRRDNIEPARKKIETIKRAMVFAKDGLKCVFCGSIENLTIDHIHPVKHGGGDELENLQTLCRSCNSRKRDKLA
jgi:hypothetical protein